jgi:hypothetical protein
MLLAQAPGSTYPEQPPILFLLARVFESNRLPEEIVRILVELWPTACSPSRASSGGRGHGQMALAINGVRTVANAIMYGALAQVAVTGPRVDMATTQACTETVASLGGARITYCVPATYPCMVTACAALTVEIRVEDG